MVAFHPLAAALGAEVSGIDLREPIDDATFAALHRGLIDHQVIFFREQHIEPKHHHALALRFGKPVAHPAYPTVPGFPDINVLENTPEHPTKIDTWHTDMTFQARPPMGSILIGRIVPEVGGDTMWASLYAAYESLSTRMQRYVDGLVAVHSFSHGFRHSLAEPGGQERLAGAVRANPPVRHPVVRIHPESGKKALFVNRLFTTMLEGPEGEKIGEPESDAVLRFLLDHLETPELACRFRWTKNAIAFWDNRATLHRPVNDYGPCHRLMERITIEGDVPR